MSDYISIKDDRLWQILFDEACVEGKQAERIQKELEKITLDEKEIIRKAFERVLERLEEKQTEYEKISEQKYFDMPQACYYKGYEEGYKGAIKIIKEECGINE